MPELKQVIVAYENRIVMEEDLSTALSKVFGAETFVAATSRANVEKRIDLTTREAVGLQNDPIVDVKIRMPISYLNKQLSSAFGQWALYGERMEQLGVLHKTICGEQSPQNQMEVK